MNKVILMGRLTKDPEIRYSQSGENQFAIARYSVAVDRKYKRDGEPTADFINCIAFGKQGEFAEKYLHKGVKILVEGRIQTGSYTNKDGQKVYTTDIYVESTEFAESKAASQSANTQTPNTQPQQASLIDSDGFMTIPDTISDGGLPFN